MAGTGISKDHDSICSGSARINFLEHLDDKIFLIKMKTTFAQKQMVEIVFPRRICLHNLFFKLEDLSIAENILFFQKALEILKFHIQK